MKITDALREEHRFFHARFEELENLVRDGAGIDLLQAKASELSEAMLSHARIENEVLLPALESCLEEPGRLAAMKTEHQELEGGLLEILSSRVANAEIDKLEDVRDAILGIIRIARQHMAREEGTYGMVEEVLEEAQLDRIGRHFAARRKAQPLIKI